MLLKLHRDELNRLVMHNTAGTVLDICNTIMSPAVADSISHFWEVG